MSGLSLTGQGRIEAALAKKYPTDSMQRRIERTILQNSVQEGENIA